MWLLVYSDSGSNAVINLFLTLRPLLPDLQLQPELKLPSHPGSQRHPRRHSGRLHSCDSGDKTGFGLAITVSLFPRFPLLLQSPSPLHPLRLPRIPLRPFSEPFSSGLHNIPSFPGSLLAGHRSR